MIVYIRRVSMEECWRCIPRVSGLSPSAENFHSNSGYLILSPPLTKISLLFNHGPRVRSQQHSDVEDQKCDPSLSWESLMSGWLTLPTPHTHPTPSNEDDTSRGMSGNFQSVNWDCGKQTNCLHLYHAQKFFLVFVTCFPSSLEKEQCLEKVIQEGDTAFW